jgi:hypothetical protein
VGAVPLVWGGPLSPGAYCGTGCKRWVTRSSSMLDPRSGELRITVRTRCFVCGRSMVYGSVVLEHQEQKGQMVTTLSLVAGELTRRDTSTQHDGAVHHDQA